MKWVRFSKYTGDDLGVDAQDLMQALADFFLQSGFHSPYTQFSEWNQHTLEDLKNALQRASLPFDARYPNDHAAVLWLRAWRRSIPPP